MGMLVERIGVIFSNYLGFIMYSEEKYCIYNFKWIVVYEVLLYCIMKLFNKVLEERFC